MAQTLVSATSRLISTRFGHLRNRDLFAVCALLLGAVLLRADLPPIVQHLPAGNALTAIFQTVPMPGGPVPILRPPAQTRPVLTALIAATPSDATLYRLRAQQAEMAIDFVAAEADWKLYTQHASNQYDGQIELADFYHRRIRSREEIAALTAAAETKDDPLKPAWAQPGWHAFERMAALVQSEGLPVAVGEPVFRAWVARYPKEPDAWRKCIEYLGTAHQFAAAEAEIAAFGRNFHDENQAVRMRAELALHRGDPTAAIAIYDAAFQPLWPEDMRAAYFKLLTDEGHLRDFTAKAHTALAANPTDRDAAARLFHYYRSQNNFAAARRTILEYRIAKESGRQPWTPAELQALAQLFEWLPDLNEAARLYYALYSAPPAGGPHQERALYGLANLLLTSPEQPIQFGAGDLSFYKDIGTVDPSPGFLNGILSLLLNWTGAREEYRIQNEKAAPYFHRTAGRQLVGLLEKRFPNSAYRAPLRALLVTTYVTYGDNDSAIRSAREYLTAFPNDPARVSVALLAANALAREKRTTEEFALYDQILKELGAKSDGVPIGNNPQPPPPAPTPFPSVDSPDGAVPMTRVGRFQLPFAVATAAQASSPQASGARSAEYVQVLNQYLSRLRDVGTPLDILRVYRIEIGRNPNDEGLYERMAQFLEQQGVSRDVEALYTQTIAKFPTRSWYDRLAHWYLRQKEYDALTRLTRDVTGIFSGTELEEYFGRIVTTNLDAALYLQLNRYAHERFPEDLVFVHNLYHAYTRPETHDAAAADRLIREYWYYDDQFRARLFEHLSATGQLDAELREVRAGNPGLTNGHPEQALAANPAAVQFVAQGEAWLSHFEAAAPVSRALANAYPGSAEFTRQASALYRSLAAYDPRNTEIAVTMADHEQKSNPRDAAILAKMGDILADRELFSRARAYWERMPSAQPGQSDAWLDTATVYWDYYQYNDALRWIAAARKKFGDPALYAYQAGAIYEGKRDYPAAVREYVAGALQNEGSCSTRLLRLLSRTESHDLVDRDTAAAAASHPSREAVDLRISVLEAMQDRPAIEKLLAARVEAEQSPVELTYLQEAARRLGFDRIEARASERMVPITNDPVDKMRLTLANVRLHESRKDIAEAGRLVDALYRDHPLILGVVRGAVDFHVRNHQPAEAIGELLDASQRARADLAAQFTLEASRVASDAGQYDRARTLLSGLLSADPLRAEYLTAMADTYLRAKDDAGFRDYQLATIQKLQQSTLSPAERVERIATIRRSLVPAFDRLKDYAGAVDQYIEVVNRYPEDEALTREAAAYAVSHGLGGRLVAFYRKTTNDAPLDYRWPIVLGRIETVTEDFPAAIADYNRGIKARPDRADVVEAKARLEERLMRFDDALTSYARLYELAYRDPQWMIKIAELRARTGRTAEAITALKTATIGRGSESSSADMAIAQHLDSWHIYPDAVTFAERAASLNSGKVSTDWRQTYLRIMAQGRRIDALTAHLDDSPEVQQQAHDAASVVSASYTPEDKVRLEQALIAQASRRQPESIAAILLPFARDAGMVDLVARWERDAMMARKQVNPALVTIEARRGRFAELGRTMEQYAAQHPGDPVEGAALNQAAQAYVAEGDVDGQMRVMRLAVAHNELGGPLLERYFGLLLARQPDELVALARSHPSHDVRNRAVQFAIAQERTPLAYRAIDARGSAGLQPVWARAYTALTGVYLEDRTPAIDAAFQAALDTRNIGERLLSPLKPDSVIVGKVWFYYGARYGEYLGAGKSTAAADWLPASLEFAPGDPNAYMALGDWYAEAGQGPKAIEEYEAALQLDADRADAHDHAARVLWSEGRQSEAIDRWKQALATYLRIQSRGVRVPEPFWHWAAETFNDIGERHALGQVRPELAHLLGDYYQRNNQYRFDELLQPAARASVVSGEGLAWLVELSRSAQYPDSMLHALSLTPGLSMAQRIELQRDKIALDEKTAQSQFGDALSYAVGQVTAERVQLVSMLLDAGEVQSASAEWRLVPPPIPDRPRWDQDRFRDQTEIRLASRTGTLDGLLARYRNEPKLAPMAESLRLVVGTLREEHDDNGARALLEFVYDRALHDGELEPANFLGLAEVKLERGDTAAALTLLNRMALVAENRYRTSEENGFDTLQPASDLLSRYGKNAEAADFLRRRLKAVPWDAAAKMQLALSLPTADVDRTSLLASVLADSQAAYKLRSEAARLGAGRGSSAPAGTELAILSSPSVSPSAAEKPFQVEARVEAARESFDAATKLRLWQEALAIAPDDDHVRVGTIRAALASGRDSYALALEPRADRLTADERASVAEALAAAAERLDDLDSAMRNLRTAMELRPKEQRDAIKRKIDTISAEQQRRTRNAARQPAIRDIIEQDHPVRPRILRSAQ